MRKSGIFLAAILASQSLFSINAFAQNECPANTPLPPDQLVPYCQYYAAKVCSGKTGDDYKQCIEETSADCRVDCSSM